MAHLRSYKSFNLQEIEEIESRIFGPTIPSENILKGCPGSTNIPHVLYETCCGTPHRRKLTEGDANKWEAMKDNIIRVLHHARYTDPMIVHINQQYMEDDDLENYEESNVSGIVSKKSEVAWPKHMLPSEVQSTGIQTASDSSKVEIRDSGTTLFSGVLNFFGNMCRCVSKACFCRKEK